MAWCRAPSAARWWHAARKDITVGDGVAYSEPVAQAVACRRPIRAKDTDALERALGSRALGSRARSANWTP